jgi:nucleoside-diphosphate-sugar epimerase
MPFDVSPFSNVRVFRADLENPASLSEPCQGADILVHFAGVLFAPRPGSFLTRTNVEYVQNLVAAALAGGVQRFILISFPHVEGESTPESRATGRLDGQPRSVHARTRLAAEKHLFESCEGKRMVPVSLRAGMIYGRDVLMIEAARWLLRRHLLAVWREPTWIHLLAMPDFLACVEAAIEGKGVAGIYNLGDDQPLTLQEFLDIVAAHWGARKSWRCPKPFFYAAGWCCEVFAALFGTASPLTRDFIRIGMASYASDTSRMKQDLLSEPAFPSLESGLTLL